MTIPASVKRQADEAARIQQELNAPPAVEQPEELEQPASQAENKRVEPETPTPTPQPPVEETRDAAYWQQRFQVIDGKYRAEVPRLQGQVNELSAKVAQLTEQLEQAKAAPPPSDDAQVGADFLTADEREEYGDLAEVIARVAQRVADARTNPVQQQVQQIGEQVHQTKQMTAEDRFFSALTAHVPNWPEINQDPAFGAFLGETEPLIGRERQALLDEAFAALDVERVARFFTAFQAHRPTTPAAPPRPSPERKVQPTSRAQQAAPVAGKTYTTAEINQFYKDKSLGKWNGREAEARAIEQDILAAGAEGRIIR